MALEFISGLTEAEFYDMLSKEPQKLRVVNVSDVRQSKRKADDYFFYVDFMGTSTGQEMGVAYGIKKIKVLKINTSSHLEVNCIKSWNMYTIYIIRT